MSFLNDYKIWLQILSISGLCPFKIENKLKLKYASFRWIYSATIVLLAIIWILITLTLTIIHTNHKIFLTLRNISNYLQSILVSIFYVAIAICYLYKSREQINYLNNIINIDVKICAILGSLTVDTPKMVRRNKIVLFIVMISYIVLNLLIMWNETKINSPWFETISNVVLYILFYEAFMITVQIRFCALLLQNRFTVVQNQFFLPRENLISLMEILKTLLSIKQQFEATFSTLIVLNVAFDLSSVIVTLFLYISVIETAMLNFSTSLTIFIWYFGPTILKNIYLISCMNGFGAQVSDKHI